MVISKNYRFLLRLAIAMSVATAVLGLLLLHLIGHHAQFVPLWGQESMATDLIVFSLGFGFMLSWTATKMTRQALQQKKVLPLHWHLKSQTLIDRLPAHTLHRAFMLGLAGVVLAGIMLLLIQLKHIEEMPYQEYLVLFVMHAVSLAAIVTVMAVYRALGDQIPKHAVVEQKNPLG